MGVPKFFSWLNARSKEKGAFRGVILRRPPQNVSSVAIDLNGLIHTARSIVYGVGPDYNNPELTEKIKNISPVKVETLIFETVATLIRNVVKTYLPRDALILAVDGPTNIAKLTQQKGRRYRTAVLADGQPPDSNVVTPGTDFMLKLDAFLRNWMVRSRQRLPPNLIYSSHLVPGEGEHKIMAYYRSERLDSEGIHILYGLDADLIMLSLISPLKNIFLSREDARKIVDINAMRQALTGMAGSRQKDSAIPDFLTLTYLIGNDFLPHGPTHDSMYALIEGILKAYHDLEEPITWKEGKVWRTNLKQLGRVVKNVYAREIDLLAAEAANQNDKREKNLDILDTKLVELRRYQAQESDLELRNLATSLINAHQSLTGNASDKKRSGLMYQESTEMRKQFIKALDQVEAFIKQSKEKRPNSTEFLNFAESFRFQLLGLVSVFPNRFFEKANPEGSRTFDYSKFRGAWYGNSLGLISKDPLTRTLLANVIPPPTPSAVEEMALRYTEGIVWCLRYYQTSNIDSRWFYPFAYPPLMMDLATYLENAPSDLEAQLAKRFTVSFSLGYGALEQLLSVIPPYSRITCVPTFLHGLMVNDESPIIDQFPRGIVLDTDGLSIKDSYLFTPRLPAIEMDRVISAVQGLQLNPELIKQWLPRKTESIPMSELEFREYTFNHGQWISRRKAREDAAKTRTQTLVPEKEATSSTGRVRNTTKTPGTEKARKPRPGKEESRKSRPERGTFRRPRPQQGLPTVSSQAPKQPEFSGFVAGSTNFGAKPGIRPAIPKPTQSRTFTGTQVPSVKEEPALLM